MSTESQPGLSSRTVRTRRQALLSAILGVVGLAAVVSATLWSCDQRVHPGGVAPDPSELQSPSTPPSVADAERMSHPLAREEDDGKFELGRVFTPEQLGAIRVMRSDGDSMQVVKARVVETKSSGSRICVSIVSTEQEGPFQVGERVWLMDSRVGLATRFRQVVTVENNYLEKCSVGEERGMVVAKHWWRSHLLMTGPAHQR